MHIEMRLWMLQKGAAVPLPVSIWCRLLLLRLSCLRSLDSRNCLGLRCLMLLLDRLIFTMSVGRSSGTWVKPAEREREKETSIRSSAVRGGDGAAGVSAGGDDCHCSTCQRRKYSSKREREINTVSIYRYFHTRRQMCTKQTSDYIVKNPRIGRRAGNPICLHLYPFSRCCVGWLQHLKFSKWSQVWRQYFTSVPGRNVSSPPAHSRTLPTWKSISHDANVRNSNSPHILISMTEPLRSFKSKVPRRKNAFCKCFTSFAGLETVKIKIRLCQCIRSKRWKQQMKFKSTHRPSPHSFHSQSILWGYCDGITWTRDHMCCNNHRAVLFKTTSSKSTQVIVFGALWKLVADEGKHCG